MAAVILKLKNSRNNDIKTAPLGFSWTVLFFSFLVPLARKDWKMVFVMLFFCIITFGLASIYFAFIYNQLYLRTLFAKGYNLMYFWGDLTEEKMEKLRNPKVDLESNIQITM